jgi:hypothetical protein
MHMMQFDVPTRRVKHEFGGAISLGGVPVWRRDGGLLAVFGSPCCLARMA